MKSLWFTATVSFVGAIAAGVVGRWLEERLARAYRAPVSNEGGSPQAYSRPALLTVAAYAVHLAWGGLLVMPVALAIAAFAKTAIVGFLACGTAVVVGAASHFGLAVVLRCDACNRRVFVSPVQNPPYAEKWGHLNAWGSVVTRIAFQRRFRCMHCGQNYAMRPNSVNGRDDR